MNPPPPLHLLPRRSRLALLAVVATHGAAAALLVALPLAPHWRIGGLGVIVAACALALQRLAGTGAPALLRVGIDRRIGVTTRGGQTCSGEILADSCVGERLTTIVWRPDGARRARTLLVLPDTLPADDFRRLRVALRYGRAAGAARETSGTDAG